MKVKREDLVKGDLYFWDTTKNVLFKFIGISKHGNDLFEKLGNKHTPYSAYCECNAPSEDCIGLYPIMKVEYEKASKAEIKKLLP